MRFVTSLVLLCACTDTTPPATPAPEPAPPPPSKYEVEVWKETPPLECDAGADAWAEPPEAGADDGGTRAVLAALRDYLRGCYDELLAEDPAAHGQLVDQVWIAPGGDVCAVRTTLRIGLSSKLAACVERSIRGAKFEGVSSPLYVPLTYVARNPDRTLHGHPARIANIHGCGRAVSQPTEATLSYDTDDAGRIGDLKVDPWKGDQKALECAASAIGAAQHAASTEFTLRVRFHP